MEMLGNIRILVALGLDLLRLVSVVHSYTQEIELSPQFRSVPQEHEPIFYEDIVDFYEPCEGWHLVQTALRRWEIVVAAMLRAGPLILYAKLPVLISPYAYNFRCAKCPDTRER